MKRAMIALAAMLWVACDGPKLQPCGGDCESDDDCQDRLVCYRLDVTNGRAVCTAPDCRTCFAKGQGCVYQVNNGADVAQGLSTCAFVRCGQL